MTLTAEQLARVLDGSVWTARRRLAEWRDAGASVLRLPTRGRPRYAVSVETAAARLGLAADDVLRLVAA